MDMHSFRLRPISPTALIFNQHYLCIVPLFMAV